MLTITDLHVGIGNLKIIQGISLEVRRGEIVSLMGANGVGKTTFMRALSGLGQITGGTVEFEGQDITHATSQEIVEAGLIQVPEGRQLFSLMSVKENLEIGAHTKRAKVRMKENLEYVYTLFPELKEMNSQSAGNLSGGQQQMVAVGRGLMADPKLLILDQPSIGLSPIMTQKVLKAVIDIHIRGVSVLIAEQNIHDVLKIAHRAYVLEQGLIRASGTAQEMAENPDIKAMYLGH
ncbi:MAG: ABC transporter ATP-binding protein [Saccharofermentanales bacterium]|jgi:branched-chain amino acid transport system ATP-binding protein